MGINRSTIALLLEEAAERPFSGKIITLGRQFVSATPDQINAWFVRYGIKPQCDIATADDQSLFQAMGFATVESLDFSNFEECTHVFDLNASAVPASLAGRYDVTLDCGTMEHVFHVPNALRNAVDLVKEGGRVILITPSSNHLDHGFYMFSPTLFFDYFQANGLRVEKCYLIRYAVTDKPWDVYVYERDSFRKFDTGVMDSRPYAVMVIATKLPGATSDKIPQQTRYLEVWQAPAGEAQPSRPSIAGRIASYLKFIPGVFDLMTRVHIIRHKRGLRGLRYLGRY